MTFIGHVIDGQESESASGARFASVDPWTHRFADLIEANADALALADTTDMGKPISDARGRTVLN
jgi:aminomuconate-semialdehyde/2-hydroxymuconate-6-semialdehyde dehydrogenase